MSRPLLALLIFIWLFAIGAGLWILSGYAITPGPAVTPPLHWPPETRLHRAPDRATLVMLAHPRCPCTRASIGELAALMTRCPGRLMAYVLFLKPAGFPVDWEKTDIWYSAAAIPGVRVLSDDEGREAAHFRAATSGETLLYAPDGRLLFSGGITGARGHAGDNAGRRSLVSLLTTGKAERTVTPVFGCPLY